MDKLELWVVEYKTEDDDTWREWAKLLSRSSAEREVRSARKTYKEYKFRRRLYAARVREVYAKGSE